MTRKPRYNIGDVIYIKTDPDQLERLVTGITYRLGSIQYGVSLCQMETWHYDYELTNQKNYFQTSYG